jgi:D-aminopeptidase
MSTVKRIRDYNITIGSLKTGKINAITDVSGVRVGHQTLSDGPIQTGVTAVIPSEESQFENKLLAGVHVINGFGKSTGLIQIEELGTLETPIILTNTLSVGTAFDALVRHMLKDHSSIGGKDGTVNPVICECNDGYLNDIRGLHVKTEDIYAAIANADVTFDEGAVGAGRGMSCFQLKGGIGTSSRLIQLGEETYVLGSLVLSNFGRKDQLMVNGQAIGKTISSQAKQEEKGSIIMIIATDLPLSVNELRRIARRSSIGLSRVGGYMGNGSGEIAIAFSTANTYPLKTDTPFTTIKSLHQNHIDQVFQAVGESIEESVLNSMIASDEVTGHTGHYRDTLKNWIHLVK